MTGFIIWIWRGQAKVVSINGKKVFIDQGVKMATVNKDKCVLKGEEFWKIENIEQIYDQENEDDLGRANITDEDFEVQERPEIEEVQFEKIPDSHATSD